MGKKRRCRYTVGLGQGKGEKGGRASKEAKKRKLSELIKRKERWFLATDSRKSL